MRMKLFDLEPRFPRWWGYWRQISLRLILSLLCMLAGWYLYQDYRNSRPVKDDTWKRIHETGVIRVGMDASYPPFSDTPNGGAPAGLDVDIANEIVRRLGLRAEIANMGYDGLYDSLKTSQVDILISALAIDPTKFGAVLYTRPYIDAGQVLVSTANYQHMPELEGRKVAVEYGSNGDETARLWQRRLHQLDVAHFTSSEEALNALHDGKTDAALVDYVSARLYNKRHQFALRISSETIAPEPYLVGVRLASFDLVGAINAALDDMQTDGTLDAILGKWL